MKNHSFGKSSHPHKCNLLFALHSFLRSLAGLRIHLGLTRIWQSWTALHWFIMKSSPALGLNGQQIYWWIHCPTKLKTVWDQWTEIVFVLDGPPWLWCLSGKLWSGFMFLGILGVWPFDGHCRRGGRFLHMHEVCTNTFRKNDTMINGKKVSFSLPSKAVNVTFVFLDNSFFVSSPHLCTCTANER